MKIEQSIFSLMSGWSERSNQGLGLQAQIVFLFGNRELLTQPAPFEAIKIKYPNAYLVGCSTSGEICGEEVYNKNIIATAVWFEKTKIQVVSKDITAMGDSQKIGAELAGQLDKDQLVHVFVLSEGLNINGSELAKGLNRELGDKVSITGGLAGDQADFSKTVVVDNAPGQRDKIIAIGFYGRELEVGYGSMGGWDSFGVDREITKASGNILYELDNQPALELYKKYLGEHAADLPASALLFPLNLRIKDTDTSLVRTVLAVNEDDGSMVFAGDLPQGEHARLMKANYDKLVEGASGAAEMARENIQGEGPDLAILISCVGRKLVLKQRVEEELESVRDVLGPGATMTGFYSYGELCPPKPSEHQCELHNQTMTITSFREL